MSGEETAPPPQTPEPVAVKAVKRRLGLRVFLLVAVCVLALLGAGLYSLVRYGAVTPQGRLLLEARTSGLKLGRFGRLKVEGLGGDIWSDFTIRHLTISDNEGVWIDATNLHLVWRSSELFARRFHATDLSAEKITFVKRPTLEPAGKSSELPLSVALDKARARVEMLPAFSTQHGLFDLNANLDMQRGGGTKGAVKAASLLHVGDHLDVSFDLGRNDVVSLDVKAEEAAGGALSGALGLDVKQPFDLTAVATGTVHQGRFEASSHSGKLVPVGGKGAWSPSGGGAALSLDLSASRLTRNYAEMIGPHAYLVVGAAKSPTGLQAIDLKAGGEALKLTARGEVDIGKKRAGPKGLALTADSANLDKLTPWPKGAGPAAAQVRLTGGLADWAVDGKAQFSKLEDMLGFNAASAAGPVRIARKKGELDIDASLQFAGGSGEGIVPGLLGAAPTAAAKLAVLSGGVVAMRELHVRGAGVTADGDGGRDLLGRLTFKGQANVTNLAVVREGAKGGISGAWSAVMAKDGWAFTADATGADFTTGLDQLDRLLGKTPKLKGEFTWNDGVLDVASAELNGAAGSVSGVGSLGKAQALSAKLDWQAKGPFAAGPVEIAGDIKGKGEVTGTLAEPRVTLAADVPQIDIPSLPLKAVHLTASFMHGAAGDSGRAALSADSAYGPAKAAGDFRFIEGGVALSNIDADAGGIKATGAVALTGARPSSADLKLDIGKGILLDGGNVAGAVRIVDASGGPHATLDLAGSNILPPGGAVSIRTFSLKGDGPLANLPITLAAQGRQGINAWTLSGSGTLLDQEKVLGIDLSASGAFAGAQFTTRSPIQLRSGADGQTIKAALGIGGGEVNLDAGFGKATRLAASWKGVSLSVVNQDLTGNVEGSANLRTDGGKLAGEAAVKVADARQIGAPANLALNADVKAALVNDKITVDGTAGNDSGLTSKTHLVLPATTSASPLRLAVNTRDTMSGTFQAQGEVAPLWNLLVGSERRLSGKADIDTYLAGSLADLHILGTADVTGGAFADAASGLTLQNVDIKTEFRDVVADVVSASASDGAGGSVKASGRIGMRRAAASTLTMDLTRFRLIDNSIGTALASGKATIDRDAAGKVRLSGVLNIDRADIAAKAPVPTGVTAMDVIERNMPERLQEQNFDLAPRRNLSVALDVDLNARRGVFLQGRGLNVELSLASHVGGTTAAPILTGVAHVVRGDYDFAGKRFQFDPTGSIVLDTDPAGILLNLSATRDDPSLTAVVKIGGTAAKPLITLTSTPQLPNDEVLSRVLFGSSAAQLSPIEAAQLASALSSLAGGGGFDVIGNLRSFAGLDRLAFAGGGDGGGVTVAGGKYLTDNVYLEIIGGGREGPAAQVEWRVQKSLSIISRLAGSGDAKLSVRWRRDY